MVKAKKGFNLFWTVLLFRSICPVCVPNPHDTAELL